jgi:HSP20 family protein
MTAQPPAKHFLPGLQRSASTMLAPFQREFNRLLDELGDGWNAFTEVDLLPRIDIRETKTALELTVELPGIALDDVKLDVEDDVLTISGEKRAESETKDGDLRVSERSYGAFSRSVKLPRSVDVGAIKATMTNGVLKIEAPKDGSAVTKTIKIEAAK